MVMLWGEGNMRHGATIISTVLFTAILLVSTCLQSKDTSAEDRKTSVCPEDMVEVQGDFCPLVIQNCIDIDESVHNVNGYVRCLKFAPTKCLSKEKVPMHFCIDRYGFPNKKDVKPDIMVSWYDGKKSCEDDGKRLCVDHEWALACEGSEILPYPYGYIRDDKACNIDHNQRPWFHAESSNMTPDIVDRLDQRVPSGSMPECVSPYGVYDMTGNVDEFTINSSGHPFVSALMGGHWVKGARNRCRPETLIHGPTTVYYEIGFRCCMDVK